MPVATGQFLNQETIIRGDHSMFALPRIESYPAELTDLAKINYKIRTVAQNNRIGVILKDFLSSQSWINCGAMTDGKLEADNKVVTREFHNIQDTDIPVDHTTKYAVTLYESTHRVVEPILACGLKTFSEIAGAAVPAAEFVIPEGFTLGKAYRIPGRNSDGSAPTIATVVGSVDGALTKDEDYVLQPNDDGSWNIVPFINADATKDLTTTSQTLTVTYAYTPSSARVVGEGGIESMSSILVMLWKKETTGKVRWWVLPKVTQTKGFNMDSKKYNDEKGDVGANVEVNGKLEDRLPAGFQGLIRYDEVNV